MTGLQLKSIFEPLQFLDDIFYLFIRFFQELELYNEILLDKPAILCVNKMDTDFNNIKFNKLLDKINKRKTDENIPPEYRPAKFIEFLDILPISAKNSSSTKDLKEKLRTYLDLIDDEKRRRRKLDDDEIIKMDEKISFI